MSYEKYPNQSKLQLISFDKFHGFFNDQKKSFLQRIIEDQKYFLQFHLSEFIELLLVNIFTISNEEARNGGMLDGGNSYCGRILSEKISYH